MDFAPGNQPGKTRWRRTGRRLRGEFAVCESFVNKTNGKDYNKEMNTLLGRNLDALGEVDPDLARRVWGAAVPQGAVVQPARTGVPTLIVNNVSLHSRFDPRAESEGWGRSAEAAMARQKKLLPVVFGWGLGYHILVLADLFPRLRVIEPDLGIIRTALTHVDFKGVLARLDILAGSFANVDPGRVVPERAHILMPHKPTVRLHQREFERWKSILGGDEAGRAVELKAETAEELGRAWSDIPGAGELLASIGPSARVGLDDLAGVVLNRSGPLTEEEIYVLLLRELSG